MGIEAPARVKYALIREAAERDGNMLNVSWMCRIAGVTRSGYYAWLDAAPARQSREEADQIDFANILEAYRFRGRPKGARGIHMRLLHTGIRMNLKKIRRLMGKYGLKCPVRKENPYRQMARQLRTSNVAPNLVQRNFHGFGPRKILLTDITYLFYKGEMLLVNHSGCHDQRDSGLPAEPLSGGVLRVGNGGCSGAGLRQPAG
ncbi:MAG: IS3 family transposase [Oscillospiraceae bacterium]